MTEYPSTPDRCTAAAKGRRPAGLRAGAPSIALVLLTACAVSPLSARESESNEFADRILLVSTRSLGSRCDASVMADGLRCEELIRNEHGSGRWLDRSWNEVAGELATPLPTIIFIHGNRVASGEDKTEGLTLYRSIAARRHDDAPIRFIIWSWPSSQIPGRVKDYQVKAARTKYVSWQLAWAIDQMPVETPLSFVGYSYGARVTTGALHLLAGGRLGELELAERAHPTRPPVKAALVAAAVDADWIRPGGYHGLALRQADELLLVNNHLDPAMRFYHMIFEGRVRPLGYAGLPNRDSLGGFATRIRTVDVTNAVGRHHALVEYLAAAGSVGRVLQQVAKFPATRPQTVPEPTTDTTLADK